MAAPVLRTVTFISLLAIWAAGVACAERKASYRPGAIDANHAPPPSTVIWCFVGSRDMAESLRVALDSNLITHVAIFAGNRHTSDTLERAETKEAIEIARAKDDVKLILVRYLWRTQPAPGFGLATLTDKTYYINEIAALRREATAIGADAVALDTEAYGPTKITGFFRSKRYSQKVFTDIQSTVEEVVKEIGKVDYILPAGSARRNHPYIALATLGENRIAEGTYHDRREEEERLGKRLIDTLGYSYEVAGMYVHTTKANERHPHLKYFLAKDVFESRRGVWEDKDAVMIWPRENLALEVALTLRQYGQDRQSEIGTTHGR